MIKNYLTFMVCLAVFGCSDQEYNWRTMRFERVGPRSRFITKTSAEQNKTLEDMGQIPEKAQVSPQAKPPISSLDVYRLYISDQSQQKGQGWQDFYIVRNAPPEKLAELLAMLFPGQGPGGSERTRWIVYTDDTTASKAQDFARYLDASGKSNWDQALGYLYASSFPRKMDTDTRYRIVSLLNRVMADRSQKSDLRWSAGIIAANLYTYYDPKDFIAASASLAQSSGTVSKSDYKNMVVRYHQLRLLQSKGLKSSARMQAQEALSEFQKWENTDCYQFIRRFLNTAGRASMSGIADEKLFSGNAEIK